jgi:hypothetical protein
MKDNDDFEKGVCSFCGKSRKEVHRLVGGPNIYICDKCVLACADFIQNDREDPIDSLEERRCFFRNVYFIMETDRLAFKELCGYVRGIASGLRLADGYCRGKIDDEIPDQPA